MIIHLHATEIEAKKSWVHVADNDVECRLDYRIQAYVTPHRASTAAEALVDFQVNGPTEPRAVGFLCRLIEQCRRNGQIEVPIRAFPKPTRLLLGHWSCRNGVWRLFNGKTWISKDPPTKETL